jgi:hypothetical protein
MQINSAIAVGTSGILPIPVFTRIGVSNQMLCSSLICSNAADVEMGLIC